MLSDFATNHLSRLARYYDAVVVNASTTCKSPDILAPGSFSWHVLSSLTDEVRTFQNGEGPAEGRVFGISMTTRRASSLR